MNPILELAGEPTLTLSEIELLQSTIGPLQILHEATSALGEQGLMLGVGDKIAFLLLQELRVWPETIPLASALCHRLFRRLVERRTLDHLVALTQPTPSAPSK